MRPSFAFRPHSWRIRVALFATGGALLGGSLPSLALANGRFPAADQLVIDPRDPRHLAARTTFGFLDTLDRGGTWAWICEGVVGSSSYGDPPLAVTGDGTLIVARQTGGLMVSHDHGCTWSGPPSPLGDQVAVDLTLEPTNPDSLLAVTSTAQPTGSSDAAATFVTLVLETKDNGRTWARLGSALPGDFFAETLEIARSDPNRLYVSGFSAGSPTLERSEDRGETWTRITVPAKVAYSSVFISAIDPQDADRLWIRVEAPESGGQATALQLSGDKGQSWQNLAETPDAMLGFALSPDGKDLAYGSQAGVFLGPSDGSGTFQPLAAFADRSGPMSISVQRCLTWGTEGLYACGFEITDGFNIGLSIDKGKSFTPIYTLSQTCPKTCAASSFQETCGQEWSNLSNTFGPLVGTCPGATVDAGAESSVMGAGLPRDGGGSDPGSTPTAVPGGDSGASGAVAPAPSLDVRSQGCSVSAGTARPRPFVALLFAGLLVSWRSRRARRTVKVVRKECA